MIMMISGCNAYTVLGHSRKIVETIKVNVVAIPYYSSEYAKIWVRGSSLGHEEGKS